MRLIGERWSQINVAAGSDKVLMGYPVPAGGIMNGVKSEIKVIGPESTPYNQAAAYGYTGFVVPIIDPDSGADYDAIWDAAIPKDVAEAANVFDLDTGAADLTPEFELGEPDWAGGVLDYVSNNPVEIFRKRKLLTLADVAVGYVSVDSATDTFTPVDKFRADIKRNVRVDTPSMVLFGFSSPSMDVVSTSQKTIPTEDEWTIYRYLRMTLENAFVNLIGMTEAGAETPYSDMADFVGKLIEDTVFEESAGWFAAVAWLVFGHGKFDISVPDSLMGTLTNE